MSGPGPSTRRAVRQEPGEWLAGLVRRPRHTRVPPLSGVGTSAARAAAAQARWDRMRVARDAPDRGVSWAAIVVAVCAVWGRPVLSWATGGMLLLGVAALLALTFGWVVTALAVVALMLGAAQVKDVRVVRALKRED
ncbi:MAG: hypothetical protein ACRCZP_16325 [Phycicoccus sp.]